MKKPLVLHPFLMALFPILFLYSHNIDITLFSEILLPALVVLSLTFVILYLLRLVVKDYFKAGIITTIILIIVFSYGHIFYSLFYNLKIGGVLIGRERYILPLYSIVSIFIIYVSSWTIKIRYKAHICTNYLNILAIALVSISLISIGIYNVKRPKHVWPNNSTQVAQFNNSNIIQTNNLPDIYYIILDMYASSDTLKEIYDFDNSNFINFLKKRGFYIAYKSRSNYPITDLSLASSLNMEYINYVSDKLGVKSRDKSILHQMIRYHKAWQFLQTKGYHYVNFYSGWGPTQQNPFAHTNYCLYKFPSEFTKVLINTTILSPFFSKYYAEVIHRNRILYSFEKLTEIPDIKVPTFTFAHLLIPHGPYVFDRDGQLVPQIGVMKLNKRRYLDQLIFVNKKIEEIVDKILSKSETPPIIIIQSDHGPALTGDFKYSNDVLLREKFNILNVYYLPKNGNKFLYESITPVNSFRLIFNYYFDAKYDLLEDISYFSDHSHPYKFIPIRPEKLDYSVPKSVGRP